jgi:RecJ-like exonuclease
MKCPECNGSGRMRGEPHYRCEDCDGTGRVLCEECGEVLEDCQCNENENNNNDDE